MIPPTPILARTWGASTTVSGIYGRMCKNVNNSDWGNNNIQWCLYHSYFYNQWNFDTNCFWQMLNILWWLVVAVDQVVLLVLVVAVEEEDLE